MLEVPDDYVMLYTPGSDTGAVEAAFWGMLGARGVQVIGPDDGPLAEGESGPGRLREPEWIVRELAG